MNSTKNWTKYEILIPFAGIILIFIVAAMFLYLGFNIVFGMDKAIVNQCANILFYDSYNPLGYDMEFMHKYCLKIVWGNSSK